MHMKNFKAPNEVYQELFVAMHESGIWQDEKAISDALPKARPEAILAAYRQQKTKPDFDLKAFTDQYFDFPEPSTSTFKSDTSRSPAAHIEVLWDVLKREADKVEEGSSLIPLPYPYIVPGGRFNEIYYWDSYFTMLGLQVSGRVDIIENMINNFSYLIDEIGLIPNGNRTYFLGRSQPPFYAQMVALLAEELGEQTFVKYLPQLEREYAFWMDGQDQLRQQQAHKRVVKMPNGAMLNRHYDNFHAPRAEMYATDVELAFETDRDAKQLYVDLRAACESGWDFTSRWLRDKDDLGTIHATEIIPVDLNCLLYNLEMTIAKAYEIKRDAAKANDYQQLAHNRQRNILAHCWNDATGFFHDYDFAAETQTGVLSLAGMFPLYFNIAEQAQAERVAHNIETQFLRPGGVVTTIYHTGQQWDAPNGWAPLQWVTIQGLRNYGFGKLANEVKNRWVMLNVKVYKSNGKMLEKYNVEDLDLLSGGGEYPVQDGFGWTNGVLLRLLRE